MTFSRSARRNHSASSSVIGRHKEIRQYLEELYRPPEEARALTSIYGISGVGKSTLLNHLLQFQPDRTITCRIDEMSGFGNDGKKMLVLIAELLRTSMPEVNFQNLMRKVRKYDELLDRFAREEPDGTDKLGEWLLNAAGIGVSLLAGGPAGQAVQLIGTPIGRSVGKGWEQVRGAHRLVRNADEREMLDDPLKTLTRAFVQDLADIFGQYQRKIVIAFDTYEQIGHAVDSWLLDYFIPLLSTHAGKCDVRLLVAGREPLGAYERRWLDEWIDFILFLPLQPFDRDEIRDFLLTLTRLPPPSEEAITSAMDITGGLPLVMARWAQSGAMLGDYVPIKDFHEAAKRITRWFTSEEEHRWAELAACCRWFNVDVLAALLGGNQESAQRAYERLAGDRSLTEVEKQGRWKLHDTVSKVLISELKARGKDAERVHDKLADYFAGEMMSVQVEVMDVDVLYSDPRYLDSLAEYIQYSLGGTHPDRHLDAIVGHFADALRYNIAFAPLLADTFLTAALTRKAISAAELVRSVANALEEMDWSNAISRLVAVRRFSLSDRQQASLLYWISTASRRLNRFHDALKFADEALSLDPTFAYALGERGVIHLLCADHQSALSDFSKAIELDSFYAGALASRGETYRQLEEYQTALPDFNTAISLGPAHAWVYAERGETHRALGEYELALADFNQALTLEPSDSWTFALRGRLHRLMHQESLANLDYSRAIGNAEDEYARACVEAICGHPEVANQYLRAALAIGLRTKSWARHDPDFTDMRDDATFQSLTSGTDESSEV